jgi:(p)ppGpp synthase/HD superfamily hydrolase
MPSEETVPPVVGPRFEAALGDAARLHAEQRRKGTNVPYVAHLLAVASLVLEDGGDEYEAIAALLHDAVEDQAESLGRIAARYGPKVAEIVRQCSGPMGEESGTWRQRKQVVIDQVAASSPAALRVELADKLHNARAILADHRRVGEALWDRFNASGRGEVLWYFRSLTEAFRAAGATGPLVDELERTVEEIHRRAGEPWRGPGS